MGCLSFFNLQEIIDKYNTTVFIETGLGYGSGLKYAQQFNFRILVSTEILADHAEHMYRTEFNDDVRVFIRAGNSYEILDQMLAVNYADENIYFWLDAHYPGGDLGRNNYDYEQDIDVRLPLEKELEVIHKHRSNRQDVIIADDLRIYERGPYTSKNLDEIGLGHIAKYNSDHFSKYQEKYKITKLYHDTGFVVMEPK